MRRLVLLLAPLLFALPALAQEGGPPPALVAVAPVTVGTVAPQATFVGTVTYPETSEVAAEANGRVAKVAFEEGQRVADGATLVVLEASVLRREIAAIEASRKQAAVEAKKARLETERFRTLFDQKTVSRQEYENYLYAGEALALRVDSLAAQVAALQTQLGKKTVPAPYDGVILERFTDRGEWLEPGSAVATMARDDEVDVIVSVPGEALAHLRVGLEVDFEAGGNRQTGRIVALIGRGDVKTRTFPVKIRAANEHGLFEGMEARVALPTGPARESFVVPRDAIVSGPGGTSVALVAEGQAQFVPVMVLGYLGLSAGIEGEGLTEGASVVVKGNERLRPGQPVRVAGGDE
ncbi:MAG: efflux RND transporter periplasmic adaptor subunit [Desulfuromonas sp.]|uniref:efflux RND transporter periplasmic adaptor subunit n=1 Tax=Desulfuromonas sp. TaxID=892 RepID=UPI000CAC8F1C|nr:efflux RND transporter periplasmic adaptor subunit [Desulfuromonas sp.]PLX82404.1 MAG: efflux RND transporter periplasmic adaptor subunit [Desulfuromonas sp.]